MKFKFVGEEPRDVPALGLLDVQPGDVIDVPDSLVGRAPSEKKSKGGEVESDPGEGFLGQVDIWEPVKSPAKKES